MHTFIKLVTKAPTEKITNKLESSDRVHTELCQDCQEFYTAGGIFRQVFLMYFLPQQVPEHEKKYETVSRQMYDFQTFQKVIHDYFLSNPADEQTNRQTEAKTKPRWQQQKWSFVDSNLSHSLTLIINTYYTNVIAFTYLPILEHIKTTL